MQYRFLLAACLGLATISSALVPAHVNKAIVSSQAPEIPACTITAAPTTTAATDIVRRDPNFISDVASVASDVTSAVGSVATVAATAVRSGVAAASSAAHNAGSKTRKEAVGGVAALVAAGVGLVVVAGV